MTKIKPATWANLILAAGVVVFLLGMLFSEDEASQQSAGNNAGLPTYVPQMMPPRDNPVTAGKVALGRHLFYDTALSFNNTIACASCHHQDKAFTDGLAVSPGATGEMTRRSAMSLANVGHNGAFTWADDTVVSLEQQAMIPLAGEHPIEMGISGHEDEVLARLADNDRYREMFADAFAGSEPAISVENIVRALASFQRTMISYNSPYDHYLAGDSSALSQAAERGRELFFSDELNCFRCHGGHNFRFTIGHRKDGEDRSVAFHNTGLYNTDGQGAYPKVDRGLLEVTGKPGDMGKFKTPTLRNVTLTAPYMHDGSIETLEAVMQHYARGGRVLEDGPWAGDGKTSPLKSELVAGFSLSEEKTAAVIAFLGSLTDEAFVTKEALSNPAQGAVSAN